MNLFKIIFGLILGLSVASSRIIKDNDIIIIEEEEEAQRSAIKVEVLPGGCIKFAECYPILYHAQSENEKLKLTNRDLADVVLESVAQCEPSEIPKSKADNTDEIEDLDNLRHVYVLCSTRSQESFGIEDQEQQFIEESGPEDFTEGLETTTTQPEIETTQSSSSSSSTSEVPQSSSTQEPPPEEVMTNATCGPVRTPPLTTKIIGGREANINEFAYIVAITYRGRPFCSATLIDNSVLLTASHCVASIRNRNLRHIKLLLGDHDLTSDEETKSEERRISRILLHRRFSYRTVRHDIALIEMSEPVEYNYNIQPVCIPTKSDDEDDETSGDVYDDGNHYGDIAGWGKNSTGPRGPIQRKLRTANVRIWEQEKCRRKYGRLAPFGIGPGMVCAGSKGANGPRDTCRGDSGGPLTIISKNNTAQQIGITSFGLGCGVLPGVYTRVDYYSDWIKRASYIIQTKSQLSG